MKDFLCNLGDVVLTHENETPLIKYKLRLLRALKKNHVAGSIELQTSDIMLKT